LASEPERVLASMAASVQEMRAAHERAARRLAGADVALARAQQTLDNLTVRWLAGDISDAQYRRLEPALGAALTAAQAAQQEAARAAQERLESWGWLPPGGGEPVLDGLARLVRNALAHGLEGAGGALSLDERRRGVKRLVERVIIAPEGPSLVIALSGEHEPLANTASPGCG
jgi:hypothetical protein